MQGYHINIGEETKNNTFFRKVLYTGTHCQLVVMSLKPGEEIGLETHPNVDQFFRIEAGEAKFIINGEETLTQVEDVVIVEEGSEHNVINTSTTEDLKLYTLYSPPNHPDGTINKTKEDAIAYEQSKHQ
jgi:mannose-6-phosphate isomerase-like protein (cupin superfamily)